MRNPDLSPRDSILPAGETAPDFVLLDQNRQPWKLSEALQTGPVVLCFYPMDFSSVCSTEMKCASAEMQSFADKGTQVVGVSTDSFFVHKAWADAEGLSQPLLADMHREVCKGYGLYFPDLNTSARGTLIIDPDRTVRWSQAREIGDAMQLDEVMGALA